MPEPVYVVGVGPGGATSLSPDASAIISGAQVLVGGNRLLQAFPNAGTLRIPVQGRLEPIIEQVKVSAATGRVVVLSSGDPGFFGMARTLVDALGREGVVIIPAVSSIQHAFALLKESWDDAVLLSAHARPLGEVLRKLRYAAKAAVLTGGQVTPAVLAQALLEGGLDGFQMYVCQDLGTPEERVETGTPQEVSQHEFSPLNVVVLRRPDGVPARYSPGIPDAQFQQQRPPDGLITKMEVRAVALAYLRLQPNSIVWDVGAGSGAVAVEAALLAPDGEAYAIERNSHACADIRANARRFGVPWLKVIEGEAPEHLLGLPAPDAAFVGGSGGNLGNIIEEVCRRLRPGGRIVVSVVTLENMATAREALAASSFAADTTQISVSRSRTVAGLTRLQAANPVFLITGTRREES